MCSTNKQVIIVFVFDELVRIRAGVQHSRKSRVHLFLRFPIFFSEGVGECDLTGSNQLRVTSQTQFDKKVELFFLLFLHSFCGDRF